MASAYPDFSQPAPQDSYPDLSQKDVSGIGFSQWLDPGKDERSFMQKINPFAGASDFYRSMSEPGMPLSDIAGHLKGESYFLAPEIGMENLAAKGVPSTADILKSIPGQSARNAFGTYLGQQFDPNSDAFSQAAGTVGSALLPPILSPFTIAARSLNPYVRTLAHGVIGSLVGSGVGGLAGHPKTGAATGGVAGLMFGSRGGGIGQIAAQDVSQAMRPEDYTTYNQRAAAAKPLGIPLDVASGTGNPAVVNMMRSAAQNSSGAGVLQPYTSTQQDAVKNAYTNFLNNISSNVGGKNNATDAAYKRAYQIAEQNGTRVDVRPIVANIDQTLQKHAPGSVVAKTLNNAKTQLMMTPQTASYYTGLHRQLDGMSSALEGHIANLNDQLGKLKSNVPDPYFRASSGYDQKVSDLQNQINNARASLNTVNAHKNIIGNASGFTGYENTVEGLDNAKKNIQDMIADNQEGIQSNAAGALKQVAGKLTAALKTASPAYGEATRLSNLSTARARVERILGDNVSGQNFFNKILNNPNEYAQLYRRLEDPANKDRAPENRVEAPAQQALVNFKTVLPDMMHGLHAEATANIGKPQANISTSAGDIIKGLLNKAYANRYHKAVAELLTNPQWQNELAKIATQPGGLDRGVRLAGLLSRAGSAAGLGYLNQQGS